MLYLNYKYFSFIMNVIWWMVCTLTLGHNSNGAQILAMLPIAAKSHWNVFDAVLQTLVTNGHNVTAITPFLKAKPIKNYTEIDISKLVPVSSSKPWDVVMGECSRANNLPFLSSVHRQMCKTMFENEKFWHAIKSNKYDLFITELLASSCDAYVSYHLKVPQIVVLSSHVHTWYHHTFGSHMNPAHVSTFHTPFAVPNGFAQRMANAYDYVYSHLVYRWTDMDATAVGREYFGRDAPDADALMSGTSLMFVNGHFTADLPKPKLPNFVDIGGIHLAQPKPLPPDIEQFINSSLNGSIYFTFGTTIKMDSVPMRIQKAFVEALSELPFNVLWKYESKIVGGLPKNVMIRKWFPQRDILDHHNIKLFISHGGISGIYEAIDSGVPVLGIPLFFDQPRNIANVVHSGAGTMLDYKTLTKNILLNAINEMMTNNAKYKLKAVELSKRFKDRPMTPREEVLYWTEYVIRHKGPHHLKPVGLEMAWYQYFLIDVLATIVLVVLITLIIISFTLKTIKNKISTFMKSKKNNKRD